MPRFRIEVDRERCAGDNWCVDQAPETFALDDDNRSFVIDPNGNWPEYILKAARGCPTDAIRVFNDETGEQVWPVEGAERQPWIVPDPARATKGAGPA